MGSWPKRNYHVISIKLADVCQPRAMDHGPDLLA